MCSKASNCIPLKFTYMCSRASKELISFCYFLLKWTTAVKYKFYGQQDFGLLKHYQYIVYLNQNENI